MNCTQAKAAVLRQQIEFKERQRRRRRCGRWFGRGHAYKKVTEEDYDFRRDRHPGWTCVCCGHHTFASPYVWQVIDG